MLDDRVRNIAARLGGWREGVSIGLACRSAQSARPVAVLALGRGQSKRYAADPPRPYAQMPPEEVAGRALSGFNAAAGDGKRRRAPSWVLFAEGGAIRRR